MTPRHLAGVTHEKELLLEDEPRGVRLEYRVRGMNHGGQGNPSNVATVVL